ncbi:fructoselysine 3-epimerase [Clostridium homopropionicum DSM 5847]|uniref:Fructoselysine 3-epimerase n=1 Tax=Clostridium homopropionicum DSM 5847 TaxID=1121318 RepID=A0A0L6Z5J5_9CLOT|nr:sugar phosphate isomerase/epimerase [Clostridium homopropionicum]KOA18221.1 fructoselysine 3-epimerase [Clostridium homopropionicum DSM 5847]SFF71043.1 Sugar phosphate isomerase/epimerase [Clostridium homopropionicum]
MEIGISSACFYPHVNLEETIALMKGLGFHKGELFLNCPSEFEENFIEKLNEEKIKHEYSINSIHAFSSSFEPFLFDSYKRRRDDMIKLFKKVCKAGKALGAQSYTFHGIRNVDLNFMKIPRVIEIYDELLYISSEIGISLSQENVSWCMSSRPDFLKTLIEKCKYKLNFTLDIKQAYRASVSLEEYIEIMGENIINLHINDVDENNSCILPGEGKVDYGKLNDSLRRINYDGMGIIEVYSNNYTSYNQLIESREYLTKNL